MTKAVDKKLFKLNKHRIKESLPDKSPCPYCNAIMQKDTQCKFSYVSIDHRVPHGKGGTDEVTNLIACCSNCNNRKGADSKMVNFWMKEPRLLREKDYYHINRYISTISRIFILEELESIINQKDLNKAVNLLKEHQSTSINRHYLSNLENILYVFLNDSRDLDSKIQKLAPIITNLYQKELKQLNKYKKKVSKFDFWIYSLIIL